MRRAGRKRPRALAGDTSAFVVLFACLRSVQLVLYARARRHIPATRALYTRYLVFFSGGGARWLSSLAVAGPARYAFWAGGLLSDAIGAMAMASLRRRVPNTRTWPTGSRSSCSSSSASGSQADQRRDRAALERAARCRAWCGLADPGCTMAGLADDGGSQGTRPPAADRRIHCPQPADRGWSCCWKCWPAHRHPGGRRRVHDRDLLEGSSGRRSQRGHAGERPCALPQSVAIRQGDPGSHGHGGSRPGFTGAIVLPVYLSRRHRRAGGRPRRRASSGWRRRRAVPVRRMATRRLH